ncbi:MAG: HtaA domain-containing protein, partial [Nocardioides sp.]
MRREGRVALAVPGLVAALCGLLLATSAAAATPEEETPDSTVVQVDGAVLRWGLNNESSNRAFAPRTYNFFSAGRVPDPGRGGTSLPRARWQQSAGEVQIQKWDGAAWRRATWAGLTTDSAGDALGSPTSGTFSNHRFSFGAGVGEVDLTDGTAHVAWEGDLTVLYYSGMSMFHVSDPVLDVADGRGTLTATVQGYASSVDDPDRWAPVEPATVTLADLPEVDLADGGLSATPAYLGVRVSGLGQATGDRWTGSFPQSFVDYMDRLGTAAFWLSSGGSTDAFKVALPLSVGFDEAGELPEPTPTAQPTQESIDNPVVPPPAAETAPAAPAPVAAPVQPT